MNPLFKLALAAALAWPAAIVADAGHDHGEPKTAAAAGAAPGFEAHSQLFELVGVLESGKLLLYLDRYRDNAPVVGANLEVEAGAFKGEAVPQAGGTYLLDASALASPGRHPLTVTVTAGGEMDLLNATLEVPAREAAPGTSNSRHGDWRYWPVALGVAFLGLAMLVAGRLRRRKGGRAPAVASIASAAVAAAALALSPGKAPAHEGHDEPKGAAPVSGRPQRLPDGSVFFPKSAQRRFAVRTIVAEKKDLPQSVALNGRVVMDPGAGGKVQATQSGRVQPGPKGLPTFGRAVARGEVLAYVQPLAGNIERGNQLALLAELRANKAVAEKKIARLLELEGTVPRKEIEQTRLELQALGERESAVGASLSSRDMLMAPVSGIIATANVVSGQVVEAREVLFEIVDPQRLMVEALAYDTALATDIAAASAQIGESGTAVLELVGVARALREQALPLLFRIKRPVPPIALGQAVKVLAETRRRTSGVPLPAAALARSPANEPVVWVHASAERFVPRVVRFQPLDAARLSVTDGLEPGERIVTEGAAVLAQIR